VNVEHTEFAVGLTSTVILIYSFNVISRTELTAIHIDVVYFARFTLFAFAILNASE